MKPFKFSHHSLKQLRTLHPELQRLCKELIKHTDFAIVEGHRSQARQNELYNSGLSKVKYPYSKHNTLPSLAMDLAPFPIYWGSAEKAVRDKYQYTQAVFAGKLLTLSATMGISIRWGGDWDGDSEVTDEKWLDFPHFELVLNDAKSSVA